MGSFAAIEIGLIVSLTQLKDVLSDRTLSAALYPFRSEVVILERAMIVSVAKTPVLGTSVDTAGDAMTYFCIPLTKFHQIKKLIIPLESSYQDLSNY